MQILKKHVNKYVDEKYGLIKRIYDLPTYPGLPNIFVKMTHGSKYGTAGFNASGAGIKEKDAENAAIGEYIERYSLMYPHMKNIQRLKYGDINMQVNPNSFIQYMRDGITVAKGDFVDWVSGMNLCTESEALLPAEIFYLKYKTNDYKNYSNSTGAACGDSYYQVCWKGLAEVFERDAIQFMWRYQISLPQLDINSNKKVADFYKTYIKSCGVQVSLYQFYMDWEIPAVFGLAEFPSGAIVVSASARATWVDACIKTMIELAQSINAYADIIFDTSIVYSEVHDFENIKTYHDHSQLYFNPSMKKYVSFLTESKAIKDIPSDDKNIFSDKECFHLFLKELRKIHKNAFYVDVTSPEVSENGWHVGRTIVPGFLDIEPGFCKELNCERLVEVKNYLIQHDILEKEKFAIKQPEAPHPFP